MSSTVEKIKPYVGPRPFQEGQEKFFYGRAREVRDVTSLIAAHRATLIYSQSGAGKTSLINVGVKPRLISRDFDVFPLARVQGLIRQDSDISNVSNIYVFNALISWLDKGVDEESLARISIAEFLAQRERKMDEEDFDELPRVLIFDQFEELFKSYKDRWEEREDFFRQIVDALDADPTLKVVFVMREDSVAEMDSYAYMLPERLQTRYRLERMDEQATILGIKEPVEKNTPYRYANEAAETLAEKLLTEVVEIQGKRKDTKGQYVEAVQLQVVCEDLWREVEADPEIAERKVIGKDTIDKIKVGEALEEYYDSAIDEVVKGTKAKENTLRNWFDEELITEGGTRGMVHEGATKTYGIPDEAIETLVDKHIIRAEPRAGSTWYEITHDSFVEPIQASNGKKNDKRRRKSNRNAAISAMVAVIAVIAVAAFLIVRSNASAGAPLTNVASLVVNGQDVLQSEITIDQGQQITGSFQVVNLSSEVKQLLLDFGDGPPAEFPYEAGRNVSFAHTYARDGEYRLVIFRQSGGEFVELPEISKSINVSNVLPQLEPIEGPTTINEGGTFIGSGAFKDPGDDFWAITADYGDGSGDLRLANDGKTFGLEHKYAQNTINNQPYEITVSVDDGNGKGDSVSNKLTVNNVPPTDLEIDVENKANRKFEENEPVTLSGKFADPGTEDEHTVAINWGDGADTEIRPSTGARSFAAVHQYRGGGDFTIITIVRDSDGGVSDPDELTITVSNVGPTIGEVSVSPEENVQAGETVRVTGTFIDPSKGDKHTLIVDWGDESEEELFEIPLEDRAFSVAHQYSRSGRNIGSARIVDSSGEESRKERFVIDVAISPPKLDTIVLVLGENRNVELRGAFTDPDVQDTHSVTIDWGDGSASAKLTLETGANTFTGSHKYANAGVYEIEIVVTDSSNREASKTSSLSVE